MDKKAHLGNNQETIVPPNNVRWRIGVICLNSVLGAGVGNRFPILRLERNIDGKLPLEMVYWASGRTLVANDNQILNIAPGYPFTDDPTTVASSYIIGYRPFPDIWLGSDDSLTAYHLGGLPNDELRLSMFYDEIPFDGTG